MALNKEEIASLYKKRSGNYDLSANLYYLTGFRENHYRKEAIDFLSLKRGDTVIEIGCGTGLNFRYLRSVVGPEGKVIGVDLTPEMLDEANKRIKKNDWGNIELVQSDASSYSFPREVNGVISTFAITLMPEYDQITKNGAKALTNGGRFVVLDIKRPERWPGWLVKLFVLITRPFGVTVDLADRKPWKSVEHYLKPVTFNELYFGCVYISVGQK